MKLYRSKGTEATCPKCHGGNAMLHSRLTQYPSEPIYECRDCGFVVEQPEMIEVPYDELITRYRNGVDNK